MEKPYDRRVRGYAACAFVATFLIAGCAVEDASRTRAEDQLATLKTIDALEHDAAAFAISRQGVRDAEVYIRENSAVVILSPAERAGVPASTIAAISAYISERAGLVEDRIIVKVRNSPMRGTTP